MKDQDTLILEQLYLEMAIGPDVYKVAKSRGYNIGPVYHGTASNSPIYEFKQRPALRGGAFGRNYEVTPAAFFFSDNKELAKHFANNRSGEKIYGDNPHVIAAFINLKNPLDLRLKNKRIFTILENAGFDFLDVFGLKQYPREMEYLKRDESKLNELKGLLSRKEEEDEYYKYQIDYYENQIKEYRSIIKPYLELSNYDFTSRDLWKVADYPNVIKGLSDMGYDGLLINEYGATSRKNTSFAVFKSTQIKLSNPVTYDDDGNVIPLEKRFDPTNPDIRY